jgi:hypothetical protein
MRVDRPRAHVKIDRFALDGQVRLWKGAHMRGILSVAALSVAFAVCAPSALGATTPEPEYTKCVKVEGGSFEKGCDAIGGKGGFGLEPLVSPVKFKGTDGASTFTTFSSGVETGVPVECGKAKDTGMLLTPTESESSFTFEQCKRGESSCASGAKSGVITGTLSGKLVATSESKTGVGITFKAEHGEALLEYKCGSTTLKTTGAISGEVTGNVENTAKLWGNALAVNAAGEPTIATAGSKDGLLTTVTTGAEKHTFPAGVSTTASIKGASAVLVLL